MIVGIDFDNTIVRYDRIFHTVAVERRLVPAGTPVIKNAVRDHLREEGREDAWTELQGYVYGERMKDAEPFDGLKEFLSVCASQHIRTFIISHKTKHPFLGPQYDLHRAAREWIEATGLYSHGVQREDVFFETSREAKISRIIECGCDLFIDDLLDFLVEPQFPDAVKRYLFDPNDFHDGEKRFPILRSWKEAHVIASEAKQSAPVSALGE